MINIKIWWIKTWFKILYPFKYTNRSIWLQEAGRMIQKCGKIERNN